MTKLGPLAADQPVGKNETAMLKSTKNSDRKVSTAPNKVAIIKNGHTAAELNEMGERWVNHEGSYLTLAETMAIEKAKQERSQDAS